MSEAEEHNDLVVEDFQESYLNLTVKTTYLLKWLDSSNCSRARFIFKVDDDVNKIQKRYWQGRTKANYFRFMWTPPTCGPHCGNLSSDLQTPIQPRSNMLSLDMFGTELRLTETLRTGKDHYSMWRWQCQCHCYIQCPGIIYHLSSILMRSFQPSSVGQPTSSLVPFSLFSTLVLSGKKSKANSYKNKHYIIWTMKCLRTPLINLEDVFLTGLCARKQLGLKFTNNKKFIPRGPKSVNARNICVFKKAVVVHNKYKPEMLDKLWSLTTQKKSSSCHK